MQATRDGAVPGVPSTMLHRFSPAATCSQSTSDDEEVFIDQESLLYRACYRMIVGQFTCIDHQGGSTSSSIDGSTSAGAGERKGLFSRQWSMLSFTTLPHSTTRIPPAVDTKGATHLTLVAAAGGAYCTSSVLMVLINKFALSAFPFASPTMLLFLQCGLCCALVALGRALRLLPHQPISMRVVLTWVPGNCIFVAMLLTSFMALQHLSVPMVTLLKSMANVFTIAGWALQFWPTVIYIVMYLMPITGDFVFCGRRYNRGVWLALLLMTLSTVAGGLTDLEFNIQVRWNADSNIMQYCICAYVVYQV